VSQKKSKSDRKSMGGVAKKVVFRIDDQVEDQTVVDPIPIVRFSRAAIRTSASISRQLVPARQVQPREKPIFESFFSLEDITSPNLRSVCKRFQVLCHSSIQKYFDACDAASYMRFRALFHNNPHVSMAKRVYGYPDSLLKRMKELTDLDLSHLEVPLAMNIIKSLPQAAQLVKLNLRDVLSQVSEEDDVRDITLTDEDLGIIARRCHRLQEVSIGYSEGITLKGLMSFSPHLRKLSVGSISLDADERINLENFARLARCYPNLEIFEIEGVCPSIERYLAILENRPGLKRCSFPYTQGGRIVRGQRLLPMPDEEMEKLKQLYPKCSFAPSTADLGSIHFDDPRFYFDNCLDVMNRIDFSNARTVALNILSRNPESQRGDPLNIEQLNGIISKFPSMERLFLGRLASKEKSGVSAKDLTFLPPGLKSLYFDSFSTNKEIPPFDVTEKDCSFLSERYPGLTDMEFYTRYSAKSEIPRSFLQKMPFLRKVVIWHSGMSEEDREALKAENPHCIFSLTNEDLFSLR
jgi:hypothetical protein